MKGFILLSFFHKIFARKSSSNDVGKLNLSNLKLPYPDNVHRSGWNGAVSALKKLHNENGILLDSYIDETFDWGDPSKIPYTQAWIGFIHFPHNVPSWHPEYNRNEKVFSNTLFVESLKYCKGLFTLSEYHCNYLQKRLEVPVSHLLHPTEIPEVTWDYDRFKANKSKKVIQLGFFLRRMHSIYLLPSSKYQKVLLKPNSNKIDAFMALEKKQVLQNVNIDYSSAKVLSFVTNEEYDTLLSENIAFTDIYDASANNVVIECMARNTPLLVNPIEPVVEYLGKDYPFYFNSMEEAAAKLEDEDLIYKTHLYLRNHPNKKKLTYDYFVESLKNSDIYKNISISSSVNRI